MPNSANMRRANAFRNEVMHLMRDFIPQDRAVWRRISQFLYQASLDGDLEIRKAPPINGNEP